MIATDAHRNAGDDFAHSVRSLLALRADQNRMFGQHLPGSAWDIIFVLFLAESEGRPTKRQDAIFVAGIDPQAGARWLSHLQGIGVVEDAAIDGCIRLSRPAVDRLRAFVAGA